MRLTTCRLVASVALPSLAFLAGCTGQTPSTLSEREAAAIADTLRARVRDAYDLSKGDVVKRMMSVYPSRGRVVSATAGQVTTTRDSLQMSINAFWDGVGQMMMQPTWTWESMEVDVLSPTVAVMTAKYTVPHWTDTGAPHVIGGVWTSVWSRGNEGWRVVHEHLSDMPRPLAERIEQTMPRHDSTAMRH